jgi:hypothetical protein
VSERWKRDIERDEMYAEELRKLYSNVTQAHQKVEHAQSERRYWTGQVSAATAKLMTLWEEYDSICTG